MITAHKTIILVFEHNSKPMPTYKIIKYIVSNNSLVYLF